MQERQLLHFVTPRFQFTISLVFTIWQFKQWSLISTGQTLPCISNSRPTLFHSTFTGIYSIYFSRYAKEAQSLSRNGICCTFLKSLLYLIIMGWATFFTSCFHWFSIKELHESWGHSLWDVKLLLLHVEHGSTLITHRRTNTVLLSICLGKLKLTWHPENVTVRSSLSTPLFPTHQ